MTPVRDLTAARAALLYQYQDSALVLGLLVLGTLSFVLSLHEQHGAVLSWAGAVAATAGLRAWWLRRYQQHSSSTRSLQYWESGYALACLAHGLAWGSMFFLFSPQDGFVTTFMNLVAAAFAFTAIATLSLSLRSFLGLISPITGAQLVWIHRAYQGEVFATLLLGCTYLIVIAAGLIIFRRALLGALDDHETGRALLAEQEALFNNSLVGLALVRERVFVRVNDECARIYGFTREQMIGHGGELIYPDRESWQESVRHLDARFAAHRGVAYERNYLRPDGQERLLQVHAHLIDTAQPSGGTIWVVNDITEKKLAELQLATREQAYRNLAETYQTLLETTPAMIWTTDKKGRYTFASERGTRALFGVPAAELTGKTYSDFVRPDDLSKELAVFKRVLAGELLLDHASEGTRQDGRRIAVSVSGAPLHDAQGNIVGASGTNVDITERQQRSTDLAQARDLLRNAIESIPDAFALFDADDRLVIANNRYVQLYTNATSFSEISGLSFEDMVRSSMRKGEPVPPEFRGDTEAWVTERVRRHLDANGQPHSYRVGSGRTIQVTEKRTPDGGIVGVRTDISELENARTILTSAINSMSDGFVLFGPDERVVLCNQPYAAMLEGVNPEGPVVGMHLEEIIRRLIAGGQPIPPEFTGTVEEWIAVRLARLRRADGEPDTLQLASGRWIQSIRRRTPDGGVVVLCTDVTGFKKSELAAQELAQHDQLTGLPNRRLLHDRLLQALARARRANGMVAVLLIDLDGFKPVNDAHGHRAGDEVLRVVANRLRECVRSADTVARYGGDEFVVVLDGVAQPDDAGAVAAKIIEAVTRPIRPVWTTPRMMQDLKVGCSVGISLYPSSDTHPDALIRLADMAMYQAKQAGRGRFVYSAKAA